jgi:protein TonB
MSASPSQAGSPGRRAWRPSLTALLIVAGAFALGFLLFLALWMQQRGQPDFYRAPVAPTSQAPTFDPLPEPAPAGVRDGASGLPEPDEEALAERPRMIERPAAPTVTQAPRPVPAPSKVLADAPPVPVSSPAPRYPTRALRLRETGTVRVRVDVGADGVPTSTSIVESSQSRDLDRAAQEAVRRWRFQPAQADGRPVVGSVIVPISFKL